MSIQTVRTGGTQHPEEMLDFLMTHIIDQSGVKSIAVDGDFYVEAQSTPNMTVKVNLGYAFIKNSDGSKVFPVRMYSSTENVTITANASGNSRIDAVVLLIDTAETPNAAVTNVAKLGVVAGTPSASPTAPSDNDISTAIGASNPFLRLANVAVGSGVSEITNANITDMRVRAINIKRSGVYATASDGATVTFDVEDRASQVTLGGNRTLALENYQVGDEFIIKLIQDGNGSRTVTWWSNIDWDNNVTPVLTTTASKADVFGFKIKSDGRFEGYIIGQGMTLS